MTIQDFGSIGEVVGAIATVATLAYLAVQIRANTQTMRAQSQREQQSQHAQYALKLAENPQLADIFRRGMADFDALSESEKIQFIFLFSQIVGIVEVAFGDWKRGVSDREQLERTTAGSLTLIASPGGRAYWRAWSTQGGYSQDFRCFIESRLDDRSGANVAAPEVAA